MQSLGERDAVQALPRTRTRPQADRSPVAVFTAVEGAVVDVETLDGSAALPALQQLRSARVPVVPVTTMTLEEIAPIATQLGLRDPMIIEAGAAIARRSGSSWTLEPLGPPADVLIEAICEIEEASGADLAVYSALPEHDAGRLSGRRGAMLRASQQRRFSEPFLIERGEVSRVARAAAELGFAVIRGQRFYHLARAGAEGVAFERLRHELGCETTIAAGSSPVDASFLSRADVPLIVPPPDGHVQRELLAKVPRAMVAPASGARGWAVAVMQVWTAFASVGARATA